jgi:hypothetical protein
MHWRGLTGVTIDAGGQISRATLDRIKRHDTVSDGILRALGDILDLPRDYLIHVGRGDVERIVRAGAADPELLRWTMTLMYDQFEDAELSLTASRIVTSVTRIWFPAADAGGR